MRIPFHILRERSSDAVDSLLSEVDPRSSRESLITTLREYCLHFHTIAVATLLIDADVRGFFLNLCRAAGNWCRLQVHLITRGEAPPPATMNEPLLGAVAAGEWALAKQIAAISAQTWQQGSLEYEDDFDWAVLLQELTLEQGEPSRWSHIITRLDQSGGAPYAERLDLIRTLMAGNAEGFQKAFQNLSLSYQERTEARAASFTTPVAEFAPYRYIWLEGLALLRLAEKAELKIEEQFRYCPPLARLEVQVHDDGGWAVPLGYSP